MEQAAEIGYSGRGRRPKALGPRTHKRCAKCGEVKSVSEFGLRRKGSTAYAAYCKPCSSKAGVAWARENKARHNGNTAAWRAANAEKAREAARGRWAADPEGHRAYHREWYQKHAEKRRERRRRYHAAHIEQEAERFRQWRLANPGKSRARSRGYDARKIKAEPPWADRELIAVVYEQCAEMNRIAGWTKYHVDHVMPLKSPILCGLHVHYNLQIITAEENLSKRNKVYEGLALANDGTLQPQLCGD